MLRRPCFATLSCALALILASALPLVAEEDAGANASSSGSSASADSVGEASAKGDVSSSQSDVSSAKGGAPASEHALEPGIGRDAMLIELSTAGYYELVARARELGLDDSGGADEIRSRLYAYYGLESPASGDAKKKGAGRTVTIERASEASFAKVEEEEGGIVRASGGVVLSLVEENGDSHRIRADTIVYNRARSTLTARGSVYYERKSGTGGTEIFTGESLSANLEDWSGVFLDGKVRKLSGSSSASSSSTASSSSSTSSSSERGLVVSADTILRRSADVMVLDKGVISSCDEDDPHYAVKANRVWLLGDKEWAVSDAVFSVGNVPILWLPFFYYPGDDLVYHPVIGYRSREGRFVQTTTYLVGRKAASTKTSSLMSYQGGDEKPTKLKGLFLRHVAGPKPKDTDTLKVICDLYSGLGGVAGVAGSFAKAGPLGKTEFYASAGRSRSLFAIDSTNYSPFQYVGDSDYDYQSVWNDSDFLGLNLPFRYGFNLSTSYASGGFNASLALPLYSDPFYEQDFTNRSEDMDWFSILKSSDTTTSTISVRSQLLPTVTVAFTPKMDFSSPWLSTFSVTKLTTYVSLLEKSSTAAKLDETSTLYAVDPRRYFFYPAVYRPFDAALSLSGTLLSSSSSSSSTKVEDKAESSSGSSLELRSPWEEPKADASAADDVSGDAVADASAAGGEGSGDAGLGLSSLIKLPSTAASASSEKSRAWSGSLGWTFTPSAYYEYRYRSDDWYKASEIDYSSLLYSLFSYKMTGGLSGSLGYGDYLSSNLGFTYTDQDQNRPYLYGTESGATSSSATTAKSYQLADKLYKTLSLTESSGVTLKPLADSWLWSGSSLAWNFASTIYNYSYSSTSSAFKETWIDWDTTSITAHTLTATLAAKENSLYQSLALTAALPPTLTSYTPKLSLGTGFSSFAVSTRMYKASSSATDYSYDPITATASLGVSPWPVLSDTFVYDAFKDETESEKLTSNSTTFAWGPLSASLAAKQSYSYKPVVGQGWVSYGDKGFMFTDLSASLAPQMKGDFGSDGGDSWAINPSLAFSQSLVRFSESSLGFTLSSTVKLGDGLSLSFSSYSLNSKAWRYYSGLFSGVLDQLGLSITTVNLFTDIYNSLAIWDTQLLTEGNFKLKSLSFTFAQDLHDWTLSAQVAASPVLDTTSAPYFYKIDPTFTLLLTWKDLSDIKTKIVKTSSSSSTNNYTLTY
jgi:hypothetical protein